MTLLEKKLVMSHMDVLHSSAQTDELIGRAKGKVHYMSDTTKKARSDFFKIIKQIEL